MSDLTTIPLTTLSGDSTSLAAFPNHVLLIVNVASKCGLTPQYTALEALYQKYKDRGFSILGFPSNDFGAQEPGTNEEIATFCSIDYPVTFPLFAKTAVTGPDKHPLYAALIEAQPTHIVHGAWREGIAKFAAANGLPGPNPLPELLWNFEKFLVGRDGTVLARFAPDTPPDDPKLVTAIEKAFKG